MYKTSITILKFSDQLWRYANKSLQNKAGNWKYEDITWLLPSEGQEGAIEDSNSGKVLGFKKKNVKLEKWNSSQNKKQRWLIGSKDKYDYFTITNPETGRILSAKNKKKRMKLTIEGKFTLTRKYLNDRDF